MVSLLLREEIVSLSEFLHAPSRYLKGVVRLVDEKSKRIGLFLDAAALDELLEEIESRSPAFLEKLKASRASGRVSSLAIKKRLGL